MKYKFIVLFILFNLLLTKETIKSKGINSNIIKPKEGKNKINNLSDKDLVRWTKEDININNSDYQYDINKLMEQFKIDKGIITETFKRKIEPYKNQRDHDIKNLKSLYSERRKEIRKKYGIRRKPENSDRKKIKNIEKSK